ncbi:ribosome assembly RNA-binding protein YhbY [Nitrosomonas supralitoralis]|uniref:Ribosome assembly RNA-binding protein YhbY n=1 Tax=Nitrosomonas supralitoralis TaxID=2116706 RepID=A0A2P7NVB6_9PROT|nr:ribosome assembly RNA-binding protein YhbY [Nitrosomonas supralitoralis]PSJ17414.1 ribosome assembly RNA-binding protein YhbY [Nitrosomonas supralitoralis]
MLTLTIAHRRELKAQAHALNPVVMIGKSGLSSSVIEELNRGLSSHELIKIKVQIDDRIARNELFEQICQQLNAAPVQHIGKIFVIYRPKPEEADKKVVQASKKKTSGPFRTKRSFQN